MNKRNVVNIINLAATVSLLFCFIQETAAKDNKTGSKSSRQSTIPVANATTSLIRFTAGYSDATDSYDPFVIYYNDLSTFNFDGQYDALKMFNTDSGVTNFYVFGNDSSRLSINAVPFDGSGSTCNLRLGLRTEKTGTVVFKIQDISGIYTGVSVYLTDNDLGKTTNLLSGGEYAVTLPAGDYQHRFSLTMGNFTTAVPEPEVTGDLLKVSSARGIIRAEVSLPTERDASLTIYNLIGNVVYNKRIDYPGSYDLSPSAKDGIYIVSLTYDNKRISKKIFFHH
ncbi:MAG TPA: T9SS type A sorting domain-containing protein [Bacteroidales bacterium]|nr:T9SS type A sorting domain-containing protein [Bacteroidales bacterium]